MDCNRSDWVLFVFDKAPVICLPLEHMGKISIFKPPSKKHQKTLIHTIFALNTG